MKLASWASMSVARKISIVGSVSLFVVLMTISTAMSAAGTLLGKQHPAHAAVMREQAHRLAEVLAAFKLPADAWRPCSTPPQRRPGLRPQGSKREAPDSVNRP